MRLIRARVRNYRSIRDSGMFEVEQLKTILVGPNEAGKTALLQALQQLNPPKDVPRFNVLRDYPRSDYNDITIGKVDPKSTTVVEGYFALEPEDQEAVPEEYRSCIYVLGRRLDNSTWHRIDDGPARTKYSDIQKDLVRLSSHMDARLPPASEGQPAATTPSSALAAVTKDWQDATIIEGQRAAALKDWLTGNLQYVAEDNSTEEGRHDKLVGLCNAGLVRPKVLATLEERIPVFVLFGNYFRVIPLIQLDHLATRIETNLLDDAEYDYGNQCLLKLLGFTARQLSNLGRTAEPPQSDPEALRTYRAQLDSRQYQLNAASVRLTNEIREIWNPNRERGEAEVLRIIVDGQYLKVVVEDSLGVQIELDQRSAGFQWLVSFFVVFFAEAADKHENAILLLDEPGLSLHALKQREFRFTISRLAEKNQTLYTTHSPFLVGPDELDIVRVVEMPDRGIGTKVHSDVTSTDPGALLPLQEALGYDLAQSLFSQRRNLVLEGLTDYWYLEAVAALLCGDGDVELNAKIALIPAQSAGKVVYFATILHANNLKVAALLDSDSAGDQAAQQEVLVHRLGNKNILRTKDVYKGKVGKPEIEDLLRDTLVKVAKSEEGWDVEAKALAQTTRPIIDLFEQEVSAFSKYKLAKAFLRWSRDHTAADLTSDEREQWKSLIEVINKVLK